MHINNNSPFEKINFVPIEQSYSYEATVFGLRMPTGNIIINFNPGTRYGLLKQIADQLGAEIVNVKGTWSFEPSVEVVDNGANS